MHTYAYPSFIAKCHIYFISLKKKKEKNPQEKKKRQKSSHRSQLIVAAMLHLSTWRVCSRQVSNQRPLPVLPWATSGYPLRHPRSGPLKVIPFSKIYTLKIILQISCIKRRQKVPDRLPLLHVATRISHFQRQLSELFLLLCRLCHSRI